MKNEGGKVVRTFERDGATQRVEVRTRRINGSRRYAVNTMAHDACADTARLFYFPRSWPIRTLDDAIASAILLAKNHGIIVHETVNANE